MNLIYCALSLYLGLLLGSKFPAIGTALDGVHRRCKGGEFYFLHAVLTLAACDALGWIGFAAMMALPALWLSWRFYSDWREFRLRELGRPAPNLPAVVQREPKSRSRNRKLSQPAPPLPVVETTATPTDNAAPTAA